VAAAVAVAAAISGCTGSGGSSPKAAETPVNPCRPIARDLIASAQRYVDGFGVATQPTVNASATPSASPTPTSTTTAAPMTQQDFADAVTAARNRLAPDGCSIPAFQEAMTSGLQAVHSNGAIAGAVLMQLRASLTGQLPSTPVSASATPHDDLAARLAQMPDGSTLLLAKGTYKLTDTLVLLRSVTIRGAGPGATFLTSTAPDAVVLALTGGRVNLSLLAVRRLGGAGSVITAAPQAQMSLKDVHVSGARTDKQGAGGVGVLLTATGNDTAASALSFISARSSFTDNASGGILAGGGQAVAVTASSFARNVQCGVCFLGASGGSIDGNSFLDNGYGVVAASAAKTAIRGNHFIGGAVAIEATGNAKPTVVDNTIMGSTRASMVFTGNAAGTVDGNDCSGDPAGIAVARSAFPFVRTNKCRVTLGK
jgi:hypothetical protein